MNDTPENASPTEPSAPSAPSEPVWLTLPDIAEQLGVRITEVRRMLKEGDLVVIVAGSPPGIPGSTNALRVHRMGDAVAGVAEAYRD